MLLSFHFPKISSPAQESLEPFSGVLWREPATQSPRIPICCSIATTMYWLSTKNVVVSFPRFCSLALLLRSPACKYTSFRSSTLLLQQFEKSRCLNERRVLKGAGRMTKNVIGLKNELDEKDLSHIMWWKERMQMCKKPSTVHLVKRLIYSNLLGVDPNLKNGK